MIRFSTTRGKEQLPNNKNMGLMWIFHKKNADA